MGWLFLGLFNMHPPAPKRGFLICNNWLKATTYAFLTNYSPPSNTFRCTTSYLDKKKKSHREAWYFLQCLQCWPTSEPLITFGPHSPGNKHIRQVKEHISLSSAWPARGALCLAGAAGNQLGTGHGTYTPLAHQTKIEAWQPFPKE